MWSHAVLGFIKSQTKENKITDKLARRYSILGYGAVIKLVVKAMRILAESETL